MFCKGCLEQLEHYNHMQVFPLGENARDHVFDFCGEASAAEWISTL